SSLKAKVSSRRPQPSGPSIPARVYSTVSMSAETSRPWNLSSSPTLTTTVRSMSGRASRPLARRAPPTPPESSTTFMTAQILLTGADRFTMADRMTSPSAPERVGQTPHEGNPSAPRVVVLLPVMEGADLGAALAVVGRQVYEPAAEVVVVGDAGKLEGVRVSPDLEPAVAEAHQSIDYF